MRARGGLRLVLLAAVLAVVLTGCAVETVEGDIADQQLCVAAQPVADQIAARGA